MEKLKTKRENNSRLGFTLITVSFFFYFLPDFALIDLLPDAIAYLLLYIGLSKLSFLNYSLEDARNLFLRMIFVGVARLVSILFTFGMTAPKEQVSVMLLMIFVFAVLDAVILIPAYIKLFDGLLYLGTRYGGTAVFGNQQNDISKSATDKIKIKTIAFVIIKNLLLILPETPALSISSSTSDTLRENIGMIEFIPHMRILGMIISLGFGIFWFCSIISYFRSLKKDTAFIDAIKNAYEEEVLNKSKLQICRRIKTSGAFLAIAALLALDFYIGGNSGYNVIPDALFAVFCFFGMLMIRKYIPKVIFILNSTLCFAYAVFSSFNAFKFFDFFQKYSPMRIWTKSTVFYAWVNLIILSVIESLLFLGLMFTLIYALKKIVDNHTGTDPLSTPSIYSKFKLDNLHSKLNLPLLLTFVFSVLSTSGGVIRVFMISKRSAEIDSSWLWELGLTLVFTAFMLYAINGVVEAVKEKYKYH